MTPIPDREHILQRMKVVISDKINVDPALLEPQARLKDIGLDSFSLIELVFLAEEEFRIRIPIEQLEVKTVGDVLDVIATRMAAPG
jgi:acyl carrier protein